jgi:hypothetical protein
MGMFIGREAWRRALDGCGEVGRAVPCSRGERGEVGV